LFLELVRSVWTGPRCPAPLLICWRGLAQLTDARARAQLGVPWTTGGDIYSNVINLVVSNTGATTVPSGWLVTLTSPTGAPYSAVSQVWNMLPTLFKGSLAAFANQARAPAGPAPRIGLGLGARPCGPRYPTACAWLGGRNAVTVLSHRPPPAMRSPSFRRPHRQAPACLSAFLQRHIGV